MAELRGEWISRYTYHDGASSQHDVLFELSDSDLLLGKGTDDAGSEVTLTLEYDADNNVLTGTWREVTSPTGEYRGAAFHGAVQFILNPAYNAAEGQWVGFNSNRDKVNSGTWTLTKNKLQ